MNTSVVASADCHASDLITARIFLSSTYCLDVKASSVVPMSVVASYSASHLHIMDLPEPVLSIYKALPLPFWSITNHLPVPFCDIYAALPVALVLPTFNHINQIP